MTNDTSFEFCPGYAGGGVAQKATDREGLVQDHGSLQVRKGAGDGRAGLPSERSALDGPKKDTVEVSSRINKNEKRKLGGKSLFNGT